MRRTNETKETSLESLREWYSRERVLYESLAGSVRSTLVSAITHANIPLLDVAMRAKTLESFSEKVGRKGYQNPQKEMTDLAGIRVIAFIESDVDRICKIIEEAFNVHKDKSSDKLDNLGDDRFGYRSVHYVCDLGGTRISLPENTPYKDKVFEIQVRTLLQHTWAEIEHDRGYKFGEDLPTKFKRRLNLQAAILEQVDQEFNRLSAELDQYAIDLRKQADEGNLKEEINAISLFSYMQTLEPKLGTHWIRREYNYKAINQIIAEIKSLKISTLADLNKYLSPEFLKALNESTVTVGTITLIRLALMYADIDAYFKTAFKAGRYAIPAFSNIGTQRYVDILNRKHGVERVAAILAAHNVGIMPDAISK